MNEIETIVFSNLMKRETKIYTFGDWKLWVPLAIKPTLNLMLSLVIWTFPILKIFGMGFLGAAIGNIPIGLIVSFGPPIGLAILISKPSVVFNNKNFYAWLWCNITYAFSPHHYADGKACAIEDGSKMQGDFIVWMGDSTIGDDGRDMALEKRGRRGIGRGRKRKGGSRNGD